MKHSPSATTLFVLAAMTLCAFAARAWEPALPATFPSGVAVPPIADAYAHFIVRDGGATRLAHVFEKGQRGERIVIVGLGGSITSGAFAEGRTNQWGYVVSEWFRRTFPKSEVEYVNAGVGATGNAFACFRLGRDVCVHKPDVVGIDFAVNDGSDKMAGEFNESVVRRLLELPTQPFVFQLAMVSKTRKNCQERHIPVSVRYDLPHFSVRDALLPLFEAERLCHKDFARDELHPNRVGHIYVGALVCHYLTARYADYMKAARPPAAIPAVPEKPLYGHSFDYGEIVRMSELKLRENRGFVPRPHPRNKAWKDALTAQNPGDRLVFEVDAPTCALLHYRINGPMGMADVKVDGVKVATCDCWFSQTWGGYTPFVLLWRDKPGRHTVEIAVSDVKAPQSTGHTVEIDAILLARPTALVVGVPELQQR